LQGHLLLLLKYVALVVVAGWPRATRRRPTIPVISRTHR
jgi:hypothetical protein